MNILFLGDIVGKSGREVVLNNLSSLISSNNISLVIVNGENAAHGKGITFKIYNQLINSGVDYITMGNHTYSKKEILDHIAEMDRLVVPRNHVIKAGQSYRVFQNCGIRFCVCNLLGQVLIGEAEGSPYEAMNEILEETKTDEIDYYFVDLHAETTAEKRVFAEFFKDRIKTLVGTHTHIQTADEQLIGNCAFITDVGMCGAYNSVIGRDIDESIEINVYGNKTKYTIAENKAILNGVVISVDEESKNPTDIKRIQIRP